MYAGIVALTHAITSNGALTVLNLAANSLGQMVLPEGWTKRKAKSQEEWDAFGREVFVHTDGSKQKDPSKAEGVTAIANGSGIKRP